MMKVNFAGLKRLNTKDTKGSHPELSFVNLVFLYLSEERLSRKSMKCHRLKK
jgi:hypothetical protein